MNSIPTEMEKIATAVAIGSIFSFGVFLVLDSYYSSFFSLFEGYVTTASFGVIAAIPTLAFLYILGALISLFSDFIFQLFNPKGYMKEWEMLAEVVKNNNHALSSVFFDLHRKKKILEGSLMPFLVLGLGVLLEYRNLATLKIPLIITGISIIILACFLPIFTTKVQKNMGLLVKLVSKHSNESQ